MQTGLTNDGGREPRTSQAAAVGPETPAAEGQADVEGFFDIVRLGPPICLPILPKPRYERPEIEPLGDPRLRQVTP
jgi:hypothetical protein